MVQTPNSILAEIKLTGELGGQYVANILHLAVEYGNPMDWNAVINFNDTDEPIGVDYAFPVELSNVLNDATAVIPDAFLGRYLDVCPAALTLHTLQCRAIAIADGEGNVQEVGSNTRVIGDSELAAMNGTRGAPISTLDTGLGIRVMTAVPKRLGKIFIPSIAEADSTSGVPVGALITAAEVFVAGLVAGYSLGTTGTARYAVVQRKRTTPTPLPTAWFMGETGSVGLTLYTQRKRKRPL